MKNSIKNLFIYFSILAFAASCSLDEDNRSAETTGNYFKGEAQYEELVNEAYIMLRPLLRNTASMWYGTDIYERTGELNDTQYAINDYTVMKNDECATWWTDNYNLITKVNVAFDRSANIADISDATRLKREGELYTLRAYAYFNLVETFGGVPILLKEITKPEFEFVRASEQEVYDQIVSDLNIALESGRLPDQPEAFGHVSQGMANHMMAKVLLTRSYKSFAQATDLTRAITCAQKAYSLHPLVDNWNKLFGSNGYVNTNTEAVFSVRYSTDEALNGAWGNNLYQHFKFWTDQFPGGSRTVGPYWRQDGSYQPTAYYLSLFEENDLRVSQTYLQRTIYASAASKEGTNGEIKAGDPTIYFPVKAMTQVEKDAYLAAHKPVMYVVNPNEYHKLIHSAYTCYPIVWKFYDPNIKAYYADQTNPRGTRDTYIFRSAETIMLLAEAYVKQGKGGDATSLINLLRKRASATLLTTDATLDDVLEESARELFGESNRWIELKRSGNLLTRAQKYNVFVNKQNPTSVPSHYGLRPIPQYEIELSKGSLKQNPGYSGASN